MYNRYKGFVDNASVSGEKSKPKPRFYESLHEILNDKPAINPQYIAAAGLRNLPPLQEKQQQQQQEREEEEVDDPTPNRNFRVCPPPKKTGNGQIC